MNLPLHQIQVTFSQEEDRLQLRINTNTHEIRFWLTRRLVKRLWPVLQQSMEASAGLTANSPVPKTQVPLVNAMPTQALSQPNDHTQSAEAPKMMPLGPLPILVTKAQIAPTPDGKYHVGLHPQQGSGLEMAMEIRHLHALGKLLFEALAKTDWDLSLSLPAEKHGSDYGNRVLCQVESNYKFN